MLVHRWMGVVFCVLFLVWFLSGIVMMYSRFPRVEPNDRLSRAPVIDRDAIQVAPDQALEKIQAKGSTSGLRLNMLDGRPVYRFSFGRRQMLVFADNGERLDEVAPEMALRIASSWTGFPATDVLSHELMTKDDQWTVYSSVRPYGPFWKSSWPNGEVIYVSQRTGEVVQDTTRSSRLGAYFGAIPHWLYFTGLRSNGPLWTQVIIWLSAIGTAASVLGLIAGIWLFSPSKRYRFPDGPSAIPYAGFKRWHMFLGLAFGVVTCTWIFSGLMSMGPFSWMTDPGRPPLERALRSGPLQISKYSERSPRDAIAATPRTKELEWIAFGGQPLYFAKQAPRQSRIIPMHGQPQESLSMNDILTTVRRAVSSESIAESRLVTEYESYYVDRNNQKPLPVVYVRLRDAAQSSYYIDPKTGSVVQSYGVHSRWNRWLYHGLHSMDLPWLYAHRPAWDLVVLLLMLGGTVLSATSIVIAWRVVRRKIFRIQRQLAQAGGAS